MGWLRLLLWGMCAVLAMVIAGPVAAQSSACNGNEDVATFSFTGATATNAAGSSRTWTAGSTANTYNVATAGSSRANTISFVTSLNGATWGGGFPAQGTTGNVANSLSLYMTAAAAGGSAMMRMNYNRPMDKVRFEMYDVDLSSGAWQDVLRITGSLNGNTTVIPVLTPVNTGRHTTSTVSGGNQIVATANANCADNSTVCNVRVDFANPVDQVDVLFLAGTAVASPDAQRVGFNRFSYCVPRRELSLVKTDSVADFVAGTTGTYTLTVNNQGGVATAGAYNVVDQLATQGVGFVNPQAPGGGWSCAISTTSQTDDTANCSQASALAAGASQVLALTVSISPDATASLVVDKAKVYGGGDPNKTALTSTGPLADCSAASEGWRGGGAVYFSGASTSAGCAYEDTGIVRQANLAVSKSNAVTSLPAGSITTYVINVANGGPSSAPGTVVRDAVAAGLDCTGVAFSATPAGTVTTTPLSVAALQGTGVTLTPTFPPFSTASFQLTCGVTATGQ